MGTDTKISHRSHLFVFASLIGLATMSYALSFASMGVMSVPVALFISAAKAALVLVFFMELVAQRFVNRFVVIAAIVLLSTLIALIAADVLTRGVPPMMAPG